MIHALDRVLGGQPQGTDHEEIPGAPAAGVRLTERAVRLLSVAVAALAIALVTGQPWLLALAAGPLCLLLLAALGPHRVTGDPLVAGGQVHRSSLRVFEGEPVTARFQVAFAGSAEWLDPGVVVGAGCELVSVESHGAELVLNFVARRWGRWSLGTVDVDVHDRGGLLRRTLRVELGQIEVFPDPADGGLTPVPVLLPGNLGEHTSRQQGEGVEVIGTRPFVWGERQRRINWAATTRRGGAVQLQQFASERAADVVVLLDAFADLRDPATGGSSLDESLRVAAGIVRAYLRSHDRVGVVSVGGKLHWLQPGQGDQYFYRLVQTVLDVRRDLAYQTPDLNRLPPPALPHGALVHAVTPLADNRMMGVLGGLAERGNPVVVVEIPIGDPRSEDGEFSEQLALRLWRLDREALRFSLTEKGIPVAAWEGGTLDLTFAPLLRTRIQGRLR
ncbi:DUF58 domain-containing protein [Streptacidiphilus jiangxiensis]|uniref:Uncharacterized conserved protein, DUF58 family, contains vWF domain n=1 Tax=Streptacidiphilus jiangxiensis TaxID=235985 RepID=A0A1H7VI67_STRJI|nr:DUF58 domain-containing protein [Streptacidiphilus jiangxiensis]SEM08942.1 Uncharacterized conserved protein, DUF58 family, contains vWF domain [Streptacidiphilus jiangxiensis]